MTQPEALRLAEQLEAIGLHGPVAAELRRLHAENEKFRKHIESQNEELDKLIPMAERLEAENERLKTVPMKYRRMEFNAQLQMENDNLHAQRDALRRGYWAGFEIGKREGRIEAEDALAEPQQHPVAWALHTGTRQGIKWNRKVEHGTPLYTAPPQRKPLSEEEIKACEKQSMVNGALPFEQRVFFARAIERAHGIV